MIRAKNGNPKKPRTSTMKAIFGGGALEGCPMREAIRSTRTACRDSSMRVLGKDNTRSMNRLSNQSIRPPAKPEMIPMIVPTTTEKIVANRATVREVVIPVMMRESRSRPVPGSTPSQCDAETPPMKPSGIEPSPWTSSGWV
jgi:hypothetical protein